MCDYLNEEFSPRIVKINTEEELRKAQACFKTYCGNNICSDCKYIGEHSGGATEISSCFVNYLLEKIEE